MKTLMIYVVLLIAMTFGITVSGVAQGLKDVSFSGKWFLAYDISDKGEPDHEFLLKRGYFTAQKKLNTNFSFRFTQDVTIDQEGDGEGSIEIRLKYGYLKYSSDDIPGLTNFYAELGVVHRPWIDFEQKINSYRVQGTMFLERNRVLRSADYGVLVGGLFGGLVDSTYQKRVNKNSPGRYGSFAVGIFNGGGYEALEQNNNKYLEGRLTLRPLPDKLTGLQLSLIGGYGKGNTSASPDFSFSSVFLSYETATTVLTGNYYNGVGNLTGTAVNALGNSLDRSGYSFFAEQSLWPKQLKVFGRVDKMKTEASPDVNETRYIGGLSYYFLKDSKFVADFDHLTEDTQGTDDVTVYELALEINF